MRRTGQSRGQALVIVITVLAMLFIVGLAFFVLTQAERTSSLRHLFDVRARYVAEAGVSYARMLLALDLKTNRIDSLDDVAVTDLAGNDADVNGDGKPESRWIFVKDSQGNPYGRFAAKVTDEASKLNLNAAGTGPVAALLSALGLDAGKAQALVAGRPYNAIEQASSVLGKDDFRTVRDYLTVYSRDVEVDLDRKRRIYLNTPQAAALQEVLLARGVSNAVQEAANIKDAADEDVAQTLIDTYVSSAMMPTGTAEAGSWVRSGSYYESQPGGAAGKFTWDNLSYEDGDYTVYLYGPGPDDAIGVVDNQTLHSGDALAQKVTITGGSLTIEINPLTDTVCRFSHITVQSVGNKTGLTRRVIAGAEALVMNELMVRPARDMTGGTLDIAPGTSIHQTFTGVQPGAYYVVVFAGTPGGLVGDVSINGTTNAAMRDSEYCKSSVNVGAGGTLDVDVKNNSLQGASFRGIRISQQPDAEWIEVLNLSDRAIDMSNFTFEASASNGELIAGWPAKVPPGVVIEPFQYLVFSVDDNGTGNTPAKLRSNNISFEKIWGFKSVGLLFEEFGDTIDKTFDLLPDTGGIVIMRDAQGRRVDGIEYQPMQVADFTSLERADPTAAIDSDGDGLYDGWYASRNAKGATPGMVNENIGMETPDGSRHSPAECVVFNHALSGLAQVCRLSSGQPWQKISARDVSKMADPCAYEALEFEAAFTAEAIGSSGTFEFTGIHPGSYILSILSDPQTCKEGHQIQVSYKVNDDASFSNPVPIIFSCGVALFGQVQITGLDPSVLRLQITNSSAAALQIKSVRLEPVYSTPGRININTAGKEVLNSVLQDEVLTRMILQKRPLGEGAEHLGTGDLFLVNPAYINFHNFLTVKSDVYEINCRGEYAPQDKTFAFVTIRTIVQR